MEGKRKYRAFLFSLLSVTVLAFTDKLTPTAVDGIGWVISAFVLGNAAVHTARAFGKNGEGKDTDMEITRTTTETLKSE